MAEHETVVFYAPDRKALSEITKSVLTNWPFLSDNGTGVCAMSIGDKMSVLDAITEAAGCSSLNADERVDLILELVEQESWKACLEIFDTWGLHLDGIGMLVRKATTP